MSFESRVREEWPDVADDILGIVRGTKDPLDFPQTAAWDRSCYSAPSKIELKMSALNELIEGYGTEAIFGEGETWPDVEYINTGDTYNTTLIYDRVRNAWSATTFGDWIEWAEKKGRVYA